MKVLCFAVFSLFVAASPGFADQQVSDPTLRSSIPPVDLFRLLIPDYDQRIRQWEAKKGSEDEMWHRFDIRLSESVETDFGLDGKHYLVVALEGNTGACT